MYKMPNLKRPEFYRVLEVAEGCNFSNRGTHTAKVLILQTGYTSKMWCVTEPTGNPYIDIYLVVKQNMEYVQDDYV